MGAETLEPAADAIETPASEVDLAEIVSAARGPLAIGGGRTRKILAAGAPLNVAGLSGITEYAPGALTLVAKAGTPMREISAALDAENQMLAFEPADLRVMLGTSGHPTIGGVVATNASGPRRVLAGACRDFLLGARFVDGRGQVISNGGRVMKNVTGYDLARLLCGSFGTLGVLTEVGFKVLPKPETEATLVLKSLPAGEAVSAMSDALATPFEVSGAFHDLAKSGDVSLRIEGTESSVTYRMNRLKDALVKTKVDVHVLEGAASVGHWRKIRDAEFLADKPFVVRASVKPSSIPKLLSNKVFDVDEHLDWGGGRVWISASAQQLQTIANGFEDERRGNVDEAALVVLDLVRQEMDFEGGHATLIKAGEAVVAQADRFQPETPVLAAMATELRRQFDPKGILNPGLMG